MEHTHIRTRTTHSTSYLETSKGRLEVRTDLLNLTESRGEVYQQIVTGTTITGGDWLTEEMAQEFVDWAETKYTKNKPSWV